MENKRGYAAPKVEILGSLADLTLLNQAGPNPDLQMQSPSSPI